MKVIKDIAALSTAAFLVACGGGGGGGGGGGFAGVVPTTTVAAPTTNTANAPVVTADPAIANNVLDASGNFSPDAYRSTAAQMGKDGGIAYRYGPSPADYGNAKLDNLPTWDKRSDTAFVSQYKGGDRPCPNSDVCGTWQVGSWSSNVGGYSSNIGHVAYIPDAPTQRVGVSTLAISSVSNAVFSQKPELSWVYGGDGLDEISANFTYKPAGLDASNPVAVGRCYGRAGWCMNSIMVFQGGLIAAAQSNTARNKSTAQLAAGKVPTAIAVSNSNEFAFITVWDTVNLRGEIAVVALTGLCDGCVPTGSGGNFPNYWGEWNGVYPGLPNLGNIAAMKVLGYVPLPADMKAPTEISVTTGVDGHSYLRSGIPGYDSPWSLSPLTDSGKRAKFKSRGMRQVSWVRFEGDGNSGKVIRTLNDTRLTDPISAEDTDNNGNESYVLSVADFGGRALRNYRYGPVILQSYGGQNYGMLPGSDGSGRFEYGGGFDLPGKAFHITGSNIP